MKRYPKLSLSWKFGLDISPDGVLVTISVSHSFSCFNDLKLGNTIIMATRMVSSELIFYKLAENVTLLTFNQGNKVFDF